MEALNQKKTNSLFNLIRQQLDIDKIYLYAKDLYKAKYQFLINKQEIPRSKHLNDSKAFIEYSNNIDNIYENIEEYNPNKICKILIIKILMMWLLICLVVIKELNSVVTELFMRGRKLNISLVFYYAIIF